MMRTKDYMRCSKCRLQGKKYKLAMALALYFDIRLFK